MSVTEETPSDTTEDTTEAVDTAEPEVTGDKQPVEPEPPEVAEESERLLRYNLFERVLHWVVGVTFVALMLSGLALAYPRMAWLSGLFGGGQTMRAAHPWIGVVFTVGMVLMLLLWARGMLLDKTDRAWFRRVGAYARTGHAGLDIGRWNAGQKVYFWVSLVGAVVLLVSGIPLWFPSIAGLGVLQVSRVVHHVLFLVVVGAFIIHVLLSLLFAGTMDAMTSGRVTRAWAAWHHPRWFREQTKAGGAAGGETDGDDAGDDGDTQVGAAEAEAAAEDDGPVRDDRP